MSVLKFSIKAFPYFVIATALMWLIYVLYGVEV